MAWHLTGDKPLLEPMLSIQFNDAYMRHWGQWVNSYGHEAPVFTMLWLLMTLRHKKPGHQKQWCWPSLHSNNSAINSSPLVPHICISEPDQPWSVNCLPPIQRQAITRTNAHLLSIGPWGTNFSEIRIKIQNFSLRKCIWKCCLWNGGHFVPGEMS